MANHRGLRGKRSSGKQNGFRFAQSLAYVIGINDYENGIPKLKTAERDARRLGEILAELHGYEVRLYPGDDQPTSSGLKSLLNQRLPDEVGADDRVLIYFAGHGIALDGDDGPEGFLIPKDGVRDDPGTFLPMTEIHEALSGLPCRHLLLILDCCFAGAFRWSSTRSLTMPPAVLHRERFVRYVQDPAWQVLTSAAHDQMALDVLSGDTIGMRVESDQHSPFAAALFDALTGNPSHTSLASCGAITSNGIVTATQLYLHLRETVESATTARRVRQTPGLWPLKQHDKGEFVFVAPGQEIDLPAAMELNRNNNPYRGLKSYDEKHSDLFFGRTRIVNEIQRQVTLNPLTIVLGASGTGKSSVVKAGLLPKLRSDSDAQWRILPVIRPGMSPADALARLTLTGETQPARSGLRFADRIKKLTEELAPTENVLLVVDQMEELLTLATDSRQSEDFLAQLAETIEKLPERVRLIFTLRSDFESQFSDGVFGDLWVASRYVVPPMSSEELREAIEGPASERVLYFRPSKLVDRLIDEVIQTPGAMPLLSFTLSELYLKYIGRGDDDRCLTMDDYLAVGGVTGSLQNRATQLYDRSDLDSETRETVKRIALRMVSSRGGELARRRVPRSELVFASDAENTRVSTVLDALSDARLIVEDKEDNGEPFVEPAHDALVRGWDKLLLWRRQEQEHFALRTLLTPAANDWKAGHGGLWTFNPRLSLLRQQLESARPVGDAEFKWFNQVETEFVTASVNKRSLTYRNLFLSVASVVIVLAVSTAYAFWQRDVAETARAEIVDLVGDKETLTREQSQLQSDIAEAQREMLAFNLAIESQSLRTQAPYSSLASAINAVGATKRGNSYIPEAEQALRAGLGMIEGKRVAGRMVAARNDGNVFAAMDPDRSLVIYGAGELKPRSRISISGELTNASIVGNRLSGQIDKQDGYVWDLSHPQKAPIVFPGEWVRLVGSHGAMVSDRGQFKNRLVDLGRADETLLDFDQHVVSANGAHLLVHSKDEGICTIKTSDLRVTQLGLIRGTTPTAISNDGKKSLVEDASQDLWLLVDSDTPDNPREIRFPEEHAADRWIDPLVPVQLTPDGQWVVATTDPKGNSRIVPIPLKVVAWKTSNPDEMLVVHDHDLPIKRLLVGRKKIVSCDPSSIFITDLSNLDQPTRLPGLRSGVETLATSDDENLLVAGCADHGVRIWDLTKPDTEPRVMYGNHAPPTRIELRSRTSSEDSLSDGSESLLSFSEFDWWMTQLSPSSRGVEPIVVSIDEEKAALAFAPDGTHLIVGDSRSGDRDGRILEIGFHSTPADVQEINRRYRGLRSIRYSPNGEWLIVLAYDLVNALVYSTADWDRRPIAIPVHFAPYEDAMLTDDGNWLVLNTMNDLASTVVRFDSETQSWNPIRIEGADQKEEYTFAPVPVVAGRSSMTPNGRWLMIQPKDGSMSLYEAVGNGFQLSQGTVAESLSGARLIVETEDRRWGLMTHNGSSVIVDYQDPALTSIRLPEELSEISGAKVSPDGQWLIVEQDRGSIGSVWHLGPEPKQIPTETFGGQIVWYEFTANNALLVAWKSSGAISHLELKPDGIVRKAESTRSFSPISHVVMTIDDQCVITADQGGMLRLYDLADFERPPVVIPAHLGSISTMVLSPDSKRLATIGSERELKIWRLWQPGAMQVDRLAPLVELANEYTGRTNRGLPQSE